MAETQEVRDKVVLVGLNSPVLKKEENADEDTMEELSALVETAGGETVGIVLQNRPSPDPRTFIGEGKVAEVQLYCENTGATMVIFDNDLSPSQMRVLTELLGVQVLDRCGLILDIFAQRAKTKEGRLQVELAQYKYLLPRLMGMWTHLERQEGAIGTRGPGETQLESDRRHIRRKISKLESELKEVRRVRATQRERRIKNEVPVVAIVGYNFGARLRQRVYEAIRVALIYAVIIMAVGTVLFLVCPEFLLSLFEAEGESAGELTAIGVPALRTICTHFVIAAIGITLSTVFQAIGKGFYSLLMSLMRQLIVLLPVAWILSELGGLSAIWWSFPIAEIVSLTLCLILFRRVDRDILKPLGD